MTKRSTNDRLIRLEKLKEHLKQEDYYTAQDLAALMNVNVRTITRDIQFLRGQGLPIDSDRGRGGGIRLDRHWGIGQMNLSYNEAIDLLVSLAVAEQMNSPLLLAQLGSIRRKLMASFSPDKRHKVSGLKSRILIGESASTFVLASFETATKSVVQRLHQAFVTQQNLHITYRAESGDKTTRDIEPHYLLLHYPVWYVLAWDQLRDAPRTFRCDRIINAHRLEERFKLQPQDSFSSAFDGSVLM